jgi:ABC-type antimicrobial peptide transport system ATPase subunit
MTSSIAWCRSGVAAIVDQRATGVRVHPRCPYRFEPCDKEVPALIPSDGHHAAACHLSLADKERIVREEVLVHR